MERKQQLWIIIGLTAITMMPQYALQGWLALGGQPGETNEFWQWLIKIDPFAWSLRALVEAWALVYLFSSNAKSEQDKRWLARFEVALIALITITLGPSLAAVGQNETMKVALAKWPLYWFWNFAIASYAPLMLGAVGFAFRLENEQAANQAQPATIKAQKDEPKVVEVLHTNANPALPDAMPGLTPDEREPIIMQKIAEHNGNITQSYLAEFFQTANSTIGRQMSAMVEKGLLQGNAKDGYKVIQNGQGQV